METTKSPGSGPTPNQVPDADAPGARTRRAPHAIYLLSILIAWVAVSEWIIPNHYLVGSPSDFSSAGSHGTRLRHAVVELLECYEGSAPGSPAVRDTALRSSSAQHLFEMAPEVLAIMIWQGEAESRPANRVILDSLPRVQTRFDPVPALEKDTIQPYFVVLSDSLGHDLAVSEGSDLRNGFLNSFTLLHTYICSPEDGGGSRSRTWCTLFLQDAHSNATWMILHLAFLIGIYLMLRMVYPERWEDAPRALVWLRRVIALLLVTYTLLSLPYALTLPGLFPVSLAIQPFLSILYHLIPDTVFLLIVLWHLVAGERRSVPRSFLVPVILVHYGINLPSVYHHFLMAVGAVSRFDLGNSLFLLGAYSWRVGQQVWAALAVAAIGVGIIISRRHRAERQVPSRLQFLYVLAFVMFLLWGATQILFSFIPEAKFFPAVFATKAMALVCYVVYAYHLRVAEQHREALREVTRRRRDLLTILGSYNLVFELDENLSAVCLSPEIDLALGYDSTDSPLPLSTLIFNEAEHQWLVDAVIKRNKPLLGCAITFMRKDGNPLTCETDFLPRGSAVPRQILIARPLRSILFHSLRRTLSIHDASGPLNLAEGALQQLVQFLKASVYPAVESNECVKDIKESLRLLQSGLKKEWKLGYKFAELSTEPCCLTQVFDELRGKLESKPRKFLSRVTIPDQMDNVYVRAHFDILVDILWEILRNAALRMEEAGQPGEAVITVTSKRDEDRLTVSIANTGPLIDRDVLERFRDKYRTVTLPDKSKMGFPLIDLYMRLFGGRFEPTNEAPTDDPLGAVVATVKLHFWRMR